MEKPLTTILLFVLSVPVLAGSGWLYLEADRLEKQKQELIERHKQHRNVQQKITLTDQERKKLARRMNGIEQRLNDLMASMDRLQNRVANEFEMEDPGQEVQYASSEDLEGEIQENVENLVVERIQEEEQREREQQRERMQQRVSGWTERISRGTDRLVEEGPEQIQEEFLDDMDLTDQQRETALEVFEEFSEQIRDMLTEALEQLQENDGSSPFGSMMGVYGDMQAVQTEKTEQLMQAGFSEKQTNTFWDESQQVVRQSIWSRGDDDDDDDDDRN